MSLKLIQFGVLVKKKNTKLGMKVTLFRMRDIITNYKVLKADKCHKYYKIEKNNISLLLTLRHTSRILFSYVFSHTLCSLHLKTLIFLTSFSIERI